MDTTEARDLDRKLNAATDPAEMRALITRRRLVRAGMAFDHAMQQFERSSPIPAAVLIDRHPIVIR
jgi:hypothetical protein